MSVATTEDAKEWPCPLANLFNGKRLTANCRGDECPLWRWVPTMASDPLFQSAVAREIALLAGETGKPEKLVHKQAVANVAKNPAGYGVKPDRGYCGLGGKPEVM